MVLFFPPPFGFFFFFQFFFPALRRSEKRLLLPFILLSFLFAGFGGCFAFFITIPSANAYLFTFNQKLAQNYWSLQSYFDYTLFLILASSLAFELFVVGLFTVELKAVSWETLKSKRRIAWLAAFILGALLTPPDILTQFFLAIPLILFYEVVIWYAYLRKEIS